MSEKLQLLEGADKWSTFYKSGFGNSYPDEGLVRLLRGRYADVPRSGRMIDVGFGIGANLIFFAQTGFECYGVEVGEPMLKAAERSAEEAGVKLNLGLLNGTRLDFPDNYFDIVLSWGAVYYYGSKTLVAAAIDEFYRVLRPQGVLLMAVPHPNCHIVPRLSEDLGDGRHKVDRASPYDNRLGIEIFYEATSSGWRRLLQLFGEIEEGYFENDLFNHKRREANRLFLARK